MKGLLHPAVTGAGLSFVCWFGLVKPWVETNHNRIYHGSAAPDGVIASVLFTLVTAWFLFTLLLLLARRHRRTRFIVWSGLLFFFLPARLIKDAAIVAGWSPPQWLSLAILFTCGLCWMAVIRLWRPSFARTFVRVQRLTSSILACMALCGVLEAGQLVWCVWQARSMRSPVLHRSTGQADPAAYPARPRVIWIILDELSYQQVYEHRFPGLDLPGFDRLASQATVFSRVLPAANSTELAVPSMITGLPVDRIRAGGDGRLRRLHNSDDNLWKPFQPHDTIFQDALDLGFHTGVAGWYNPYCRILSEVLDRCSWTFRRADLGGMVSDGSVLSNAAAPWIHLFDRFRHSHAANGVEDESSVEDHIKDYREIVAAGYRFLDDSSVDFLLLHLPIPHPGGIYDRRTRTFTTHRSSYIDNLALADSYLGDVRQVLEQRGEWDSSAIVVMGDHSWRTKLLWKGSLVWTAEDEAASHGGQFDDRPGYIVKLPYQTKAARIETPFSAVRTRALLRGILDGSIRSVPELADFSVQPPTKNERPALLTTRVEGAGTGSRGR